MANKYIIHGATFNGDGTSSAEAGSNGAAGAWNNINVFEGTAPAFGSLAAGDTVYIRSKDAGGSDLSFTMAAAVTLGTAAATDQAPVTWILDDGTVWPGVVGSITYHKTSTAYMLSVLAHNRVVSALKGAFKSTGNAAFSSHTHTRIREGSVIEGWEIKDLTPTQSNGPILLDMSGPSNSPHSGVAKNCLLSTSTKWAAVANVGSAGNRLVLTGCEFELNGEDPSGVLNGSDGCDIYLVGGRMYGTGADAGSPVCAVPTSTAAWRVQIVGTEYPWAMQPTPADPLNGHQFEFSGVGIDGGSGAFFANRNYALDSRNDGFYPTLNAAYPGSTPAAWSWRLTPQLNFDMARPADIRIVKQFYDTEAAQVVRLQLLVHDGWTGVSKGNVWMDVCYTDATTGLPVMVSTQEHGSFAALDASIAAWSAASWGAVGLDKKVLEVTTPTAVKQNTPVIAVLRFGAPRVGASNYAFICPDIQVTPA